ncbi:hypothetical protein GCM10027169_34990 [Gordonia jinhuaensis]|uniref:Amidohydrolase family protein n=1 Tax=Gordonia jinhuaensis TaxID=1517702 RepID=A0A916T591_9ACTN|nr:hypothetical protein GCM10011489_18140 [Gordonia jinhuaensis]
MSAGSSVPGQADAGGRALPGPLHIAGSDALSGEPVSLWTNQGRISRGPVPGAQTVCTDGWIVPGLVDAHNHVGIAPGLGVTIEQAREFARADAKAGALLIREVGSPLDTHPLDSDAHGPKFIRSGRAHRAHQTLSPGIRGRAREPRRSARRGAQAGARGGRLGEAGRGLDRSCGR